MTTSKRYIHILIMLILMIGISFLPPFGQITDLGMIVLGVFVGMLYGWIFIDLTWPSLLGMIVLGISGYAPISQIFASGLGNATTLMVISAFMFAYALSEIEFTGWLASFTMTRKIFLGNPWRLIVGITIVSYILGLTCGLAGIFVMWALIIELAEETGYKKGDKFIAFLVAMVVISLIGAGNTLPWKEGPIVFGGYFTAASGLSFDFIPFIIYTTILTILGLIGMLLFGKFIWKVDASKFTITDEKLERLKQTKMKPKQKVGLFATILYALCFLIPGIFPNLPGMAILNSLGVLGVSIIFVLALWLLKDKDGKPLINIEKACSHGVSWSLIWLLAATFPLAEAMMSEDVGIIATIAQYCTPIFSSLGLTAFYIIAMLIAIFVTQVTHNIVLAAVLYPILCPLVVSLNGDPHILFAITYMGLIAAYCTPAASVNGAMVHGHDWVTGKSGYIIGFAFLVVTTILNLVVGIPLASVIF